MLADIAVLQKGKETSNPSKEVRDAPQPPESTSLTLTDVAARLHESPRQKDAEGMLEDIAVLQQWKETNNPSNEVRDAMAKLGPRWKVRQKENGKKRPPGEVARDIEESLLDKAKVMLGTSVAKPGSLHACFHNGSLCSGLTMPEQTIRRDLLGEGGL